MFFASKNRQYRKQSLSASNCYLSLEPRHLLTILPPPPMTTDVSEFAQSVDEAVVRVNNDRLVIRTTGTENQIDIQMNSGYLQVNRDGYFSLALEIDTTQYSSVLLLSGGDDSVRVAGSDLKAQMYPDKLWVSGESRNSEGVASTIEFHGSNFEHLEVNEAGIRDVGPYLLESNNRIRMYGGEGVDRLNMSNNNSFAIATSVSLTGDGYYLGSNVFGDLYVSGGGGNDFASLVGTRGFTENTIFIDGVTDGADIYDGRDNWSRIRNELWDARFVDFETQRVDLLSGEDRVVIADTGRPAVWYRVQGDTLVGGYRRMLNVENVEVVGSSTSSESLFRPNGDWGVFTEEVEEWTWRDSDLKIPNPIVSHFPPQIVPDYFDWKFVGFDNLVG